MNKQLHFGQIFQGFFAFVAATLILATTAVAQVPGAPGNVQATDGTSTTSVTVTWTAPTGGGVVNKYKIYRSTSNLFCPGTPIAEVTAPATSFLDTTLPPQIIHYYSVRAVGPAGDGGCSLTDSGYAGTLDPPKPPTSVAATDTLQDKIAVTWTVPVGSEQVDTYQIFRTTNPLNKFCFGGVVATVNHPVANFDDTTAVHGQVYYYSIRSAGPTGTSNCSNFDEGSRLQPPPPLPPTTVSATDGTFSNKVQVTWVPPTTGSSFDRFKLYRSLTPNACGTLLVDNLSSTTTTYDDTSVTPGVDYYYSVTTVGPSGESGCSNEDPGYASTICRNGLDDDNDGKIDFQGGAGDPGCDSNKDNNENDSTFVCDNGLDDDKDGKIDFKLGGAGDPGCDSPTDNNENDSPFICDNGKDDDGDGKIDFKVDGSGDPGCDSPTDGDENDSPFVCDNGKDDDGDGKIDFKADGSGDPGCDSPTDNNENDSPFICDNGKDDDGDGKIDFKADGSGDPGCDNPTDNNENDSPFKCDNGKDDDGDGKIDFKVDGSGDPGCSSPTDDDETDPTPDPQPICNNGLDDDGDGKIDFKTDGTGDPGCDSLTDNSEDDNNAPLKSPAFAKFNTFLGQWNFAELLNQGARDRDVEVTIFNLRGEVMITRTVIVPANEQVDIDVNGLVQFACDVLNSGCAGFEDLSQSGAPNGLGRPDGVVDTYGLVRFVFDDTNPQERILGRMSFYRPDQDGSFSFAFAREFRNPTKGTTYATANTFDPQGEGNLIINWAETINFSSTPQTFTLRIFSQAGTQVHQETFTLAPLGEFDIQAGHEFLDSQGKVIESVYLVCLEAHDPTAEYFFSVSRYTANASSGAPDSYVFAFTLEGLNGTSETLFMPIGNTLDGVTGVITNAQVTNWVEVANVGSVPTGITVKFRAENGSLISQQTEILPAKSQIHFNAGAILPSNSKGSVEVISDGLIIAQSLAYIHGDGSVLGRILESGFASQGRTKGGQLMVGSINTFLDMQDLFVTFATTDAQVDATFTIKSFRGGEFNGALSLNSGGTSALMLSNNSALNFPPNTYGALTFTTPQDGQAVGEVRRYRVHKGAVDFVMPTVVK